MLDLVLLSVTVFALTLAVVSGVITWCVLQLDRRRLAQRVADLKEAAGHDSGIADAAAVSPAGDLSPMFASGDRTAAGPRWLGAAAALAVFLAAVSFGLHAVADRHAPAATGQPLAPLELLALDPVRDGDRITLRGHLKNPVSGSLHTGVMAVVQVFDRAGTSRGVVRVPIRDAALAPGHESDFEALLGAGTSVARYRLTFESDAGPVAHTDGRTDTRTTPASRGAVALDVRRGPAVTTGARR